MYLFYEVNHRSVNKVKSGPFFRSILVSQAIMNFTLWADALFDAACRVEPDNAIFFGDDFWIICKPIFKAALIALRILSALLFLMLAMHSDSHGGEMRIPIGEGEPSSCDQRDQRSLAAQSSQKKIRKYQEEIDGLDRAVNHIGTAITILLRDSKSKADLFPTADSVDDKRQDADDHGSSHRAKKLQSPNAVARMVQRSITTRLSAVKSRPADMNYGVTVVLSRLTGNRFKFVAEAISSNQMGTKALVQSISFLGLVIILVPPVVLGWSLKLVDGDDPSKYAPELLIHLIVIACCLSILIPNSPINHWHIAAQIPFCSRARNLVDNPELSALSIFAIAATFYHFFLFIFFCKYPDLFALGWAQFDLLAAIVSGVLRLIVVWIFKMHHGAIFRKRNHSITELVLGILFACSMSILIMDIQREEFDHNEHKLVHHLHLEWFEPVSGVLAPLSIDFSLHAALLLYSVFVDYVKFSGESGTLSDSDCDTVFDGPDWSESKLPGYESSQFSETSV